MKQLTTSIDLITSRSKFLAASASIAVAASLRRRRSLQLRDTQAQPPLPTKGRETIP
jgi:hypothetical protein